MARATTAFVRTSALFVSGLMVLLAAPTADPGPDLPDRSRNVSVSDLDWEPDPVADGIPVRPSRDVGRVKQQQRAVRTAGADSALDFARDGYPINDLPESLLPLRDQLATHDDPGLHDAEGVRMFSFDGQIWDHPVAQAQWGLKNVASYRTTEDDWYLNRAIANAQRNLDRKVESRGAWWYPYDFDLIRCDVGPPLRAPWYSAMAQGQLLSLFVQLYEVTGNETWRSAADRTFLSLIIGPDPEAPWASWVDPAGHLWLEEYPASPGITGERVLNGLIYAMYGVYDYWRLTASAEAVGIIDGVATTVRRYVPTDFRVLRWASNYSIGCPHPHVKYHQIHTGQTLKLYEITHAGLFATQAYLLRSDYPAPAVWGTVRFSAGRHVGYRFNSSGTIVATKTLNLSRTSSATADQRIRVYGRSIYYRMTNGALAGYLVPEAYGQRVLLGKAVEHRYVPVRRLEFATGTYTAYKYDSAGNQIGSKRLTFSHSSSAPLGSTAFVNGRLAYWVTAGAFLGYWLPHSTGLRIS
jgi:hypothetical protein